MTMCHRKCYLSSKTTVLSVGIVINVTHTVKDHCQEMCKMAFIKLIYKTGSLYAVIEYSADDFSSINVSMMAGGVNRKAD